MERMHKVLKGVATVAVVLCVATAAQAQTDSIDKGRRMAERLCAACHMNAGQGEKKGADGVPGFHAVANRPAQSMEGIVEWLKSKPPMMPNHRLTQDEIDVLSEFIMSLRKQ